MTRKRVLSIFIPALLATSVSVAQYIRISPPADSLTIFGQDIPASMIFQVHRSATGVDTIVIRPTYHDPLCLGWGSLVNQIAKCSFLVADTANDLRYELWMSHSNFYYYNAPVLLTFDSSYFALPGTFRITLRVYRDTTFIDSAGIMFLSLLTSVPGGQPESQYTPRSCALRQNYPNPFNGQTRIGFSTPSRGATTITIYDLLGRERCRLFEGISTPGNHELLWNADDLPSGPYFAVIRQLGASQTIKCMLLR